MSSAASCSTITSMRRRIRLLVDAVEGRHPAALAQPRRPARWCRIISCSISPCASVCSTADARGRRCPSASNSNSGSVGRDLERAGSAALAQRRRGAPRELERLGDQLGRALAAGEVPVELVVGEAVIGADPAAVEARRARRRRRRRAGSRPSPPGAPTPGTRLQASAESAFGSIGSTGAGHVDAVRASLRLGVERRLRADVRGDVGDVDPEPDPVARRAGPRRRRRSRAR